VGGVILTITIFVRETIQEPNRELVNKIELVGRIDALHNVSLSTNAAVAELTDDIQSSGILDNPPKKKDPNQQAVADFDLANRKLLRRLGSTELGFYDILDVAKLLPDYKGSEVETFCNDTQKSIDQYKGFLDARMKYQATDGKIVGQIPDKWMGNGIDLINMRVRKALVMVIADADATREKMEHRYKITNYVSYGLILIALVLTIIGKALDEHPETEIEAV
jgi:hypothetical protein